MTYTQAVMNPNTIPGIYNYCDRWCERCSFTNRCAIYEDEIPLSKESINDVNEVSEEFSQAIEKLHEAAAAYGFDLSMNQSNEANGPDKRLAKGDPLYLQSFAYRHHVKEWFANVNYKTYLSELEDALALNIKTSTACAAELNQIKDATEEIMWYASFIHVKLIRAKSSAIKIDRWAEECGIQKDSDGSAKIALIATERSLNAWTTLFNLLREHQDSILSLLANLQQLQSLTLEVYPNAMNFVRPGFDAPYADHAEMASNIHKA